MNPTRTTLHRLARREFFARSGMGLAGVALGQLAGGADVAAGGLHHAPKAKRVIFLFQSGGPSQLDLWDPKPGLRARHGEEFPESLRAGQRLTTMTASQGRFPVIASPYRFRRHGQSGIEVSELLPHTAKMVDDLCVIRSLHTNAINHDPGISFMQTGHELPGRPSMGAWLDYGIGSENRDLPAFVVLLSYGANLADQPLSPRMWSAGFLPGSHQGVHFRGGSDPLLYLNDPAFPSPARKRGLLDALGELNRRHFERTGDSAIEARIDQYELAYRMQRSVPGLADLSGEPDATFERYGPDARVPGTFAANCLMARRLAERDVRFVQLYHTGWDHHKKIGEYLPKLCRETDQPCAALLRDLKERDLLKDTLVVWGGEFGRTTFSQGSIDDAGYGRDHHPRCFTMWVAGGGFQGGRVHGVTDEFCYNVVEDPVSVHDLHATLLHQLGIDHERLTFRFQGRRYRLTDIHGEVRTSLLA